VIDPELVAVTVASVLQVGERPEQPIAETLTATLADRTLLIILDNCEHVVGSVAQLAVRLIASCRGVSMIATSREPLHIAGEHVYRVPSLVTPSEIVDADAVRGSEAVQLFADRARQQRHDFEVTDQDAQLVPLICRRLDGIPLAIELAAVRLRSLSLRDLDARLDRRLQLLRSSDRDVSARQQTLGALIDWSYQLLDPADEALLARLSVFASSGFDLTAAETICAEDPNDSLEGFEIVDHLDSLVDKSLLLVHEHRGDVRYRLLETIHEYASDKLAATPQLRAAVLAAYTDHYQQLAQNAYELRHAPEAPAQFALLGAEHDNLRRALNHSLSDPDPRPGLRISCAIGTFWRYPGHVIEARDTLARHLNRPEAQAPTRERGQALQVQGLLLSEVFGDLSAARASGEQALAIGRSVGDDELVVESLVSIASVLSRQEEHERALEVCDEAIRLARSRDRRKALAMALNSRGLALGRAGSDPREALRESLGLTQRAGDLSEEALLLTNLCDAEMAWGTVASAREYGEHALKISTHLEIPLQQMMISFNLGMLECLAGDLNSARAWFAQALAAAERLEFVEMLSMSVLGLAIACEEPDTAAALHGAAASLREEFAFELAPVERKLRDTNQAQLRALLGTARFDRAVERGCRLSRQEAIDLARSTI
jgi:predicted ATPase